MLGFFLLLACADPEPPALAACEAAPGLSVDAAGLALLRPLLVADEIAVLEAATQTRGHAQLGDAGLAALRAQTSCTVDTVFSAGSGRWAVTLTRTAPSIGADGSVGDAVTTQLEWQIVKGDGLRVETGLKRAAAMRKSAEQAVVEDDLLRAASTWKTLARSYPDPVLAVDIAHAEAALEKAEYAGNLRHQFESADDTQVVALFTNGGPVPLTDVVAYAVFDSSEVEVKLGAIAANETVEYHVPIPEGVQGGVKLKTRSFELGPERP
jgi:hypothetical protein